MTVPDRGVRQRHRRALLIALFLLPACGHSEPFEAEGYGTDQPLNAAFPRRLTYNHFSDAAAAWRPDGTGIYYTLLRHDRADIDRDRCLGLLPPEGGRVTAMRCLTPLFNERTTDVLDEPTPAGDGRIAYVRSTGPVESLLPAVWELVLAADETDPAPAVLQTMPYDTPDGRLHTTATQLEWLADDQLVYLAQFVTITSPGGGQRDTLRTGMDVVRLRLTAAGATREILAGTAGASSVAAGADGNSIFFTLNGDSRIYLRNLTTGETAAIHDFGPGRIVRGVDHHAGRIAAVVDGDVSYQFNETFGYIQIDRGGTLFLLDLAAGSAAPLGGDDALYFSRPRFSPTGDRIVAERRETTAAAADLWLFEVQ